MPYEPRDVPKVAPNKKMAWLDIETTGLDPDKDKILEVGLVITDEKLQPGIEWSSLIASTQETLDGLGDFVREMHTKNGLIEDLKRGPVRTLAMAEENAINTLEVLFGFEGSQEKVPLCGSTIGFDRSFLRVHMPRLDKYFHYRSIDVSSIRELTKYWYPELPEPPKSEAHRSIQDIHASIKLLKYYQDRVFQTPLAVGLYALLVDGIPSTVEV